MKKLVCTMCNSMNFIKEGNEFFCQDCGIRYSIDDAKKMLIEVDGVAEVSEIEAFLLDEIPCKDEKTSVDYYIGFVEVTKEVIDEIEDHVRSNRKLNAIKLVREVTGFGLQEAKTWVENYGIYDVHHPHQIPTKSTKSGCYIATCVYGSYDCPQVWTLRRFRDDTLGVTWYGRLFIGVYYRISPALVKYFGKNTWVRSVWQRKLDKMVDKLNQNGVKDTPYQDKEW